MPSTRRPPAPAPEADTAAEGPVRILKKYPNRRLYDTEISSYITIEDVRQLIIDGETAHARLIADAVTRSLLDISLQHGIPVIHEVLLVANEDQARRRCLESDINRGIEAARAAVAASLSLKSLTN